ncbi:MAG TPA: PAS domain S-box protein [Cellvibrio sp.]|nr:PAS domain S-box protein [Cellvibrio sp.]
MHEQDQLAALDDYRILDTPPELDYDGLTQLAAMVCATPIAVVSLVDDARQWFKSVYGLEIRSTDRSIAFCAEAIKSKQPFIVSDTWLDDRFKQDPLVIGPPYLRFYAGIPLVTQEGFALGTLAVMDIQPRNLSSDQCEALETIARQVMSHLELRRQSFRVEKVTQQRLRNILSAAATGIALVNLEGHFLSVNPAYCAMLDMAEEELLNKPFMDILHPADLPEALRLIDTLISGECNSFTHEARCCRAGGKVIWMRASVSLTHREDGVVDGMVAVTSDITDIKETEQKVVQLAQRLAATWENITDAFFTLDCEWNFIYLNSEAERLLQRQRTELVGKNIWQEFPLAVGTSFEDNYRQAMAEGNKVSFEAFYSPLNVWFRVNAYPSAEGLAIYFQDVNVQRKAQEKIRESEERFKLIARATADAIWDWDFATDKIWWGDGVENLFGLAPAELEPDSSSWTTRIHPDDKERVLSSIFSTINAAEDHWTNEYRFLCKDGSYAYVQDRGFVIRGPDGKAIRMLGGMTDLTASKRAEVEIARINESEHAQQVAELASQAKSNFLATMSHEIRTPISGVIGMVDVLHQTSLKNYQVEMLDIIRDSAYSLLGIIDDILDFSKIEAGKMDIESAPISLMNLVKGVCLMLDRFAENKGVELTLFTDPAVPEMLLGDSLRVRQVLVNLINNAIKFSAGLGRAGRVMVRTCLTEQRSNDVTLEFHIIDNGIGMSTDTLARLFNPFTQADASTTRQFGGTGLGLTISRHLVELMRGNIRVESQANQGSHFIVRLPFGCIPHLADETEPVPLAGLSCVTLGDEHSLAEDLAHYLRAAGAQVTLFSSDDESFLASMVLSAPLSGPWLWVVDARDDVRAREKILTAIAQQWPQQDIRYVIIGRGQRRKPRRDNHNHVMVDGNLLDYPTFLHAVAVALGKAEEEKPPLLSGKEESAFLPPPRDQAVQQQRLILVAEDNETNQKVILRQLALLGYAADVVSNGREALQHWQSGDYALLLTDLHMPEMDGYALAQAVRNQENGYAYIPIVALSANAVRGEAEHCHAVGMDEYLTKPVSLAELQSVLEQWLPTAETNSAPTPVDAKVTDFSTDADVVIDIRILQDLVGNEPAVVHEFLQDFRGGALIMAEDLREAGARNDRRLIASIAHKLKSSARSVGAVQLGELCARLEMLCNQQPETSLIDCLQAFERELAAVNDCVDVLLPDN